MNYPKKNVKFIVLIFIYLILSRVEIFPAEISKGLRLDKYEENKKIEFFIEEMIKELNWDQLEQTLKAIVSNSYKINKARYEFRESKEKIIINKTKKLPYFSFIVEKVKNKKDIQNRHCQEQKKDGNRVYRAGITGNLKYDMGLKNDLKAAEHIAKAALFNYKDVVYDQLYEVIIICLELVSITFKIDTLKENNAYCNKILISITNGLKSGIYSLEIYDYITEIIHENAVGINLLENEYVREIEKLNNISPISIMPTFRHKFPSIQNKKFCTFIFGEHLKTRKIKSEYNASKQELLGIKNRIKYPKFSLDLQYNCIHNKPFMETGFDDNSYLGPESLLNIKLEYEFFSGGSRIAEKNIIKERVLQKRKEYEENRKKIFSRLNCNKEICKNKMDTHKRLIKKKNYIERKMLFEKKSFFRGFSTYEKFLKAVRDNTKVALEISKVEMEFYKNYLEHKYLNYSIMYVK